MKKASCKKRKRTSHHNDNINDDANNITINCGVPQGCVQGRLHKGGGREGQLPILPSSKRGRGARKCPEI